MSPRLRVVMPVHNAADFVEEAIASALADLPPVGEVVIVLDGPTDGSDAVVVKAVGNDPRVTILRNPEAAGVSRATNQGIAHPGCPEYVAIAEHDDVVLPGRFRAQIAALDTDHSLGAVSCQGVRIGPTGAPAGKASAGPTSHADFAAARATGQPMLILHPAIMYRRAALEDSGLYDPAFDGAQDLELLNRLVFGHGWEVRTLEVSGVQYRIHAGAMSFDKIRFQRMVTRFVQARNFVLMRGKDAPSFEEWLAANRPGVRTRWTWWRKDKGALSFRRAGAAWVCRRRLTTVLHLAVAAVLHPRLVREKLTTMYA